MAYQFQQDHIACEHTLFLGHLADLAMVAHTLAAFIGVPAKPLLDLVSGEYVGRSKKKR